MTGWYAERAPGKGARAMIVVTLLALLLVAAVPVALLAAVILMLLGHVVGGLAVFGGSVLAAGLTVTIAGMSTRTWPSRTSQRTAGTTTSCSWIAASTPTFAESRPSQEAAGQPLAGASSGSMAPPPSVPGVRPAGRCL